MASHDYIPASDANFLAWAMNFVTYLSANYAALGLTLDEVTPISTAYSAFGVAYTAHNTAVQSATAAKETKDSTRDTAEEAIRSIVRQIQANSDVTDAQWAELGITVKNGVVSTSAAAAGESRPIGQVDTSQRLRHEISFRDEISCRRTGRSQAVSWAVRFGWRLRRRVKWRRWMFCRIHLWPLIRPRRM
jgi:hypothetical protein